MIAAPGRLAAGQRVAWPVSQVRLHDTLLDLAGLPGATDSLLAELSEETASPSRAIWAAAWPDPYWARSVGGRFALGHRMFRQGSELAVIRSDDTVSLFDLDSDPRALQDRAAERPERVAELVELARPTFVDGPSAAAATLAPETLEALEELGYIGEGH